MKSTPAYALIVLVFLVSCGPSQEESILKEVGIDMLDVVSYKKDEATALLKQLRGVSDQEMNKLKRMTATCFCLL